MAWVLTSALHHHLHPGDVRNTDATDNNYGRVRLRLKLPGTHAGIPEPLISCGVAGDAALVYIRLLPDNRARVGVEFWNVGLYQGPEFELPAADAEIDVTCYFPALYPPEDDTAWGQIAPEIQTLRRHEYIITVDGVIRLQGAIDYPQEPHPPLYFGINPLGGSFVSDRFTGKILDIAQNF